MTHVPMRYSTRDLQAWLAGNGFHPGPIDGVPGRRTRAAASDMMDAKGVSNIRHIFPKSGLTRVHKHWTAGAEGVIDLEKTHYNGIVDSRGSRHYGLYPMANQATYAVGRAASHTRNCNSTAVGLAMDAMAGAKERPFDPGKNPITEVQLNAFCKWVAEICHHHGIPVSRHTTLTHAEVQPTLGVKQKWKWDINWIPGMNRPGDPIEVGDKIRLIIAAHLGAMKARETPVGVFRSANVDTITPHEVDDPTAQTEEGADDFIDADILMAQIFEDAGPVPVIIA